MSRVLERLDDYRPVLAAVAAAAPDDELRERYRGTELVDCVAVDRGCVRALIVTGPLDVDLMLELVDDEGWPYVSGRYACPEHSRVVQDYMR